MLNNYLTINYLYRKNDFHIFAPVKDMWRDLPACNHVKKC